MTAMTMNQLPSKAPIWNENAFLGSMYWMVADTSSGLMAVLSALTMTVAAATLSIFIAVPTMV